MMNPMDDMGIETQAAAKKSGMGCLLKAVLLTVAVLLGLVAAAYFVVMHTAVPLRRVAAAIEEAGAQSHLRIDGVSGSIASGIAIQSITWDDGNVADVRIRYNGLMDLLQNKRLILSEVQVGKAHIRVTGKNGGFSPSRPGTTGATGTTGGSGKSDEWPLKLLQIDRVTLTDILVQNRATGFSMSIPSLEWTGFRAEEGKVSLGQLNADTDRFKIVTQDSASADFQKTVHGTLLPRLHPKIRQPIEFVADVGYAEGNVICRLSAFNQKLDLEIKPDRSGSLRCRGVDLAAYIEGPMPSNLIIDAVAPMPAPTPTTSPTRAESRSLQIRGGSFQLGVRNFQIEPVTWDSSAGETPAALLRAVSNDTTPEIRYELVPGPDTAQNWQVRQRLTAKPPLDVRDTLGQVFHGKPFSALADSEQADVEQKLASFAWPEAATQP